MTFSIFFLKFKSKFKILVIIVLIPVVFYGWTHFQKPPLPKKSETLHLQTPKGGDFELLSFNGPLNTKALRGKTLLITFGFLNCPQICPLTLNRIQRAVDALSAQEREQVQILFISIDPERDSLELLHERVSGLGSEFIGATDSDAKLKKIAEQFGARYTRLYNEETQDTFVDHTTHLFVVNAKGEWVDTLRHNGSPEEITEALKTANEKPPHFGSIKKERILEVLGQNQDCDLNLKSCEITTFDNKKIQMKFLETPIKTETDLKLIVSIDSDQYHPLEVDIEGLNLNMGLIRPTLKAIGDNTYEGDVFLPVCELSEMEWAARLIATTPDGNLVTFVFHFKTQE